jgi:hypothetical protein
VVTPSDVPVPPLPPDDADDEPLDDEDDELLSAELPHPTAVRSTNAVTKPTAARILAGPRRVI